MKKLGLLVLAGVLLALPAFAGSMLSESKTSLGLNNVENTALSTWAGSANVTTLGTISLGTWQGSNVGLAYGGTGSTLTASSGGIVWSGASTLNILAGTSTAGQMLRSGNLGAPSWSTATWPSTATQYDIIYATATNTYGNLAKSNNAVLTTGGSGAPLWISGTGVLYSSGGAPSMSASPTLTKLTMSNASLNSDGDELIDMSGTIGTNVTSVSARGLNLSLTNNPTSFANTAYGMDVTVANQSSLSNTAYGGRFSITNSANPVSGTTTFYGVYANPGLTGLPGDMESGTAYGVYAKTDLTAQAAASGTYNNYGLYVADGTSNTNGTSNKYGLYLENQTGADTNYSIYSAGGTSYFGGTLQVNSATSVDDSNGFGGGSGTSYLQMTDTTASKYPRILVNGPTTGGAAVQFMTGNVSRADVGYDDAGGSLDIINRVSNEPIRLLAHNGTSIGERVRVTGGGSVFVNGTTAYGRSGQLLETNTSANSGGVALNTWAASTAGGLIDFNKSRSATIGTHTVVQNADALGEIDFRGSDGVSFRTAALVGAEVDGAVTGGGAADMPGRLVFYTAPDGTATPTERMRITEAGRTLINATTAYGLRGTRFEVNTTAAVNGMSLNNWSATAGDSSILEFNHSLSNTVGTHAGVTAVDSVLGVLEFNASDGTAWRNAAAIASYLDAAGGATDTPGRLGFFTSVDGTSTLTERLRIANNGNIFMYDLDTAGASTNLCLSSSEEIINLSTDTCVPSSLRFKDEVRPMDDMGLKTVLALAPVTFIWKKTENPAMNTDPNRSARQMGFIAEEAQKVDARLITVEQKDPKQARSFRYDAYTAVLTKAIQEQQKQIDMLMQHNKYLEGEIEKLKQAPKAKASWLWPWQKTAS